MLQQQYENYTPEDFAVWKILFERQIKNLPGRATSEFMEGLHRIQFTPDRIPNFEETNPLLRSYTGWELRAVGGIVADDLFFKLLSEKKFPATTWLRKMEQLDYLEEPDMFHDVFAHIPLLTNQPFVDFLQAISKIALRHIDNPWAIELVTRIYWYTIEFGLIQEDGGIRIYGAGILSSAGETLYSLSDKPKRRPYDVAMVLDTPYRKDAFQEIYYVIDSYEALYASIPQIEEELAKQIKKQSDISLAK